MKKNIFRRQSLLLNQGKYKVSVFGYIADLKNKKFV